MANPSSPTGSLFNNPRYQQNPTFILFENYILDILGQLSPSKDASLQALNLDRVFHTFSTKWRDVIREVIDFSPTIDIAIVDLWISHQGHYHPTPEGFAAYARDFTDQYMASGSQVDIWPDGELEKAQARVLGFLESEAAPQSLAAHKLAQQIRNQSKQAASEISPPQQHAPQQPAPQQRAPQQHAHQQHAHQQRAPQPHAHQQHPHQQHPHQQRAPQPPPQQPMPIPPERQGHIVIRRDTPKPRAGGGPFNGSFPTIRPPGK